MNLYMLKLMEAPSVLTEACAVCGSVASDKHHVVPRSQGGKDGPRITLCGMGNVNGCHGRVHDHTLHFRWGECGWEVCETRFPTKRENIPEDAHWRPM